MKDKLRKAMLVGLGLAVVTKEKVSKLTNDLMKKGEMNEKEAKAFVNKVASEVDKNRAIIEMEIKKELDRLLKSGKKAKSRKKRKK